MCTQFTRNAGSLSDALDQVAAFTNIEERSEANSMDELLRDAGQYFSSYDSVDSASCVFRLVLLCRHDQKVCSCTPQIATRVYSD